MAPTTGGKERFSCETTLQGTFSFESGDGTKAEQSAEVKTVKVSGEAEDAKVAVGDVKGSYSYVDPEGKTHSRQYVANEYGFFVKGTVF